MDTLDLILADDDVLEGGAVLEKEDGVVVAALSLTSAADTTTVGLVTTIEGARDGLGLIVGHGALGVRDGEAAGVAETEGELSLGGGQREGGGNDCGGAETHIC